MHPLIKRMSTEEKCAQMISVDYRFDVPDPERITALVKSGVGGVCFFSGNIFELTPLINSLQNLAKYPLLMSADYENGVGHQISGATVLPSNMAVGATGSEALARLKGKVTAVEARALGVPWVLAPVVDVQSNPLNPIINTRAFGQDAALVTKLARAFAQGAKEGGALTCAKHFPGHGDVSVDSHLDLPSIDHDEARLRATELKPFVDLKVDVDSVMTGHLKVPAFDAEHPASLSGKITNDLLRKEIGFEGMIATDALMMGGITAVVPEPEALVLAARAGADLLLYPREPAAAAGILADAVKAGTLDEKRIDDAVDRIFTLKKRAGLFEMRHADPNRIEGTVGSEKHKDAARAIAEAAVTKVRDTKSLLPLTGKANYILFEDKTCKGDLTVFRQELSEHLELEKGDPTPARPCVIAVFVKQRAFSGKSGVSDEMAARIREIVKRVPAAAIVSFGSPYVLRHFAETGTYVCTYSEDEASQRAAARAIAGKIPFGGTLPVDLEV